jgi:hypothetical protein
MSTLCYKQFYRRHLAHVQPVSATLFVTFRLAGPIGRSTVERLSQEAGGYRRVLQTIGDLAEHRRRAYVKLDCLFGKWDRALHGAMIGPLWLA